MTKSFLIVVAFIFLLASLVFVLYPTEKERRQRQIELWKSKVSQSSSKTFTIEELKFPDIEKEAISENEIDTTYLIVQNQFWYFNKSDTFGYYTYDRNGRLIHELLKRLGGHLLTNQYDSNGLLTHIEYSTCNSENFEITNRFSPDSLLMYHYWLNSADTPFISRFDKNGRIVETVELDPVTSFIKTSYKYNNQGQLIKKKQYYLIPEEFRKNFEANSLHGLPSYNITKYYYSQNNIDSTVQRFYHHTYPQQDYSVTTIYNEKGLRKETTVQDSFALKYIHVKRTQ